MQLQCKHCGRLSKSFILEKDKALAEISLDFSKHIMEDHASKNPKADSIFKQYMLDIQMLISTAPTVILLAKHSTLLDSFDAEDYVQEKFSECVDKIQDFLGVEVFDNRPEQEHTAQVNLNPISEGIIEDVSDKENNQENPESLEPSRLPN